MKKKKLYTLPKISRGKTWFVYYSYRNPYTLKMQRIFIYEGFKALGTNEQRLQHGNKLVQLWSGKLQAGYDPFTNIENTTVYQPQADSIEEQLRAILRNKAKLRKTSFNSYKQAIDKFVQWLQHQRRQNTSILSITEEDAEQYLNWLEGHLKLSPTTRNSQKGFMGTLFNGISNQYRKKKILYDNPFLRLKKIPEDRQGRTPFNPEQVSRLQKHIQPDDAELWLACLFVRYTMVRTTKELPFLKLCDIDRDRALLKVRGEISKNRKTQWVYLHPEILQIMETAGYFKYPQHYYIFSVNRKPGAIPYSQNTLTNRFSDIRTKLGFTADYSMYSFKHTGNAELHRMRVPLPGIRDQNRHSDLRTTDIYSRKNKFYDEDNVWAKTDK